MKRKERKRNEILYLYTLYVYIRLLGLRVVLIWRKDT